MRSIEALGAQRKLITTNEDVSSYDLYNGAGVRIVDRNEPTIDAAFLESNERPFDDVVRMRYSVRNWVAQALLGRPAVDER
jgi:hypothetical protein